MSLCWDFWKHGVTQGCLGAFLTCPELCKLKYRQGWGRIKGSDALQFGSMVHSVLERTYNTGTPTPETAAPIVKKVEQETLDATGGLLPDSDRESLETTFSQLEAVVPEYFRYYSQDANVNWWALEHVFEVPFKFSDGREVMVRGKIDGLAEIGRKLWIFETKTKGCIEESNIMELLPTDLQVNLYTWAARNSFEREVAGVIYNIIRRPRLRQGAKESARDFRNRLIEDVETRPGFYFHRFECCVLEQDYQAWQQNFRSQMDILRGWFEAEIPHYRNSTSCQTRYGLCEFLPVCSRSDFNGLVQREEPFPELKEED